MKVNQNSISIIFFNIRFIIGSDQLSKTRIYGRVNTPHPHTTVDPDIQILNYFHPNNNND